MRRLFAVLGAVLLTSCIADTGMTPTDTGSLLIEDLVVGAGSVAATGDTVSVHYVGTLTNGREFDNSYTRNQPITFQLGTGAVIAGFDQGILGMRVGGTRKLTIPPSLGYGNTPTGIIPANSTIIFEVELVSIAGAS